MQYPQKSDFDLSTTVFLAIRTMNNENVIEL